jgi:hypothetical protein
MNSDDEVQEIDPPLMIQSGCKKYQQRLLKEEIDIHFCHCSNRNNKDVENSTDFTVDNYGCYCPS